ncbi:MAG: pantoate--beta-alanine ligase [Verrucomicrobia bacterium]|nr:pantoate--beta-alanine ligase [Verrucomicrobiota bacterium]
MRLVNSLTTMQRLALRWRRRGLRVGLVPTMGSLHAGHLSLVRQARRRVGPAGRVVVSLYVNPTQFAPHEDFAGYPRELEEDRRRCRAAGVDVLWVPADAEMYPGGPSGGPSTWVSEENLSRRMEGRARPTHFRGVATVVTKLFNVVLPTVAVFGAKDYQQAAVVRRLTRDLNFPIEVVVAPTVREPDGLAMSSRNRYLSPAEREQATVLWQAIEHVQRRVAAARRSLRSSQLAAEVRRLIQARPSVRLDYVEFFAPETLQPAPQVSPGTHMALAVWVGRTRLIDNARLEERR